MGGLYITPTSSEIGWKRRALRVSSEALLCLGVATIVASFVVDISPTAQKPNIWILICGVIMLLASSIGWSLTFCLICSPPTEFDRGNVITVDGPRYYEESEKPSGKFWPFSNNANIKKMKAIDRNAPISSVEVTIPQKAIIDAGGFIPGVNCYGTDKIAPMHIYDTFFNSVGGNVSQVGLLPGQQANNGYKSPDINKVPLPGYTPRAGANTPSLPPRPPHLGITPIESGRAQTNDKRRPRKQKVRRDMSKTKSHTREVSNSTSSYSIDSSSYYSSNKSSSRSDSSSYTGSPSTGRSQTRTSSSGRYSQEYEDVSTYNNERSRKKRKMKTTPPKVTRHERARV